MPAFSWFSGKGSSEGDPPDSGTTSPLPDDDPLGTLARYIADSEQRWTRQTARIILMKEEGRDTSRSERVLRDLEETLAVLRQRHKILELDARSERLMTAIRENPLGKAPEFSAKLKPPWDRS